MPKLSASELVMLIDFSYRTLGMDLNPESTAAQYSALESSIATVQI